VGIRGLGQTLKSFRDRPIEFPVYQKQLGETDYLDSLGPLKAHARISLRAGGATATLLPQATGIVAAGATAAAADAAPSRASLNWHRRKSWRMARQQRLPRGRW
jgi:hypothetical protein